MGNQDQLFDTGGRVGLPEDLGAQLMSAFSGTSAIGLAIVDNQLRFRFVNDVVATEHHRVPAEAFVGNTVRDIMRDAAPGPEARLQRLLIAGETPSLEVCVLLPARREPGYWIEKNFTIKHGTKVTQIASLAVEVTAQRKLEARFRNLCGELWRKDGHLLLARELHNSINDYHAALGMSLDCLSRSTRNPERIPELLQESMGFLDAPMQKLSTAIAKCFPVEQH